MQHSQGLQQKFGNEMAMGELAAKMQPDPEKATFGNVDIPQENGSYLTRIGVKHADGRVTLRDGTPVPEGSRFTITGRTGEDADAAGLTSKTRGNTQDSLRDARLAMLNMADLTEEKFGKFFSLKGRVKGKIGKGLDFLKGAGGEEVNDWLEQATGEDLVAFNSEAREVFEDTQQVFNSYRKEITGAAAAAIELERLKDSLLNGDLAPAEAFASYKNLVQRFERQIAEDERSLSTGKVGMNYFAELEAAQKAESSVGKPRPSVQTIGRFQVEKQN